MLKGRYIALIAHTPSFDVVHGVGMIGVVHIQKMRRLPKREMQFQDQNCGIWRVSGRPKLRDMALVCLFVC